MEKTRKMSYRISPQDSRTNKNMRFLIIVEVAKEKLSSMEKTRKMSYRKSPQDSRTNKNASEIKSMTPTKYNNIVIFGLSANPPTGYGGHTGIVKDLAASGKFDEIWVFPVYQHMFAAKRNLNPFEHRMAMAKLAFEPQSSSVCQVKVIPVEKEVMDAAIEASRVEMKSAPGVPFSPPRVGTIDVIKFLKKRFADEQVHSIAEKKVRELLNLHLVVGTDTFNDIINGKWKQSDSVVSSVTFEVIERKGIARNATTILNEASPQVREKALVNIFIIVLVVRGGVWGCGSRCSDSSTG